MSVVPVTKMVPVLITTCPDDGCNAVLIFPSKDKIVDCHGCGQRHKTSEVKDIRQMHEQALGVKNVLRSLLLATNANMKKNADLVSCISYYEVTIFMCSEAKTVYADSFFYISICNKWE
jgi:hypothetical protein